MQHNATILPQEWCPLKNPQLTLMDKRLAGHTPQPRQNGSPWECSFPMMRKMIWAFLNGRGRKKETSAIEIQWDRMG